MVANKKKPAKQTYYELCWEYLKRSELFKEYCGWRRSHPGFPLRKTPKGEHVRDWIGFSKNLPDKFKKYKVQFESLYGLFGDIHSQSFKKWWESNSQLFDFEKRSRVRDAKEFIGGICDRINDQIRTKSNKETSAQDLKEHLMEYLQSTPDRALVDVYIGGNETSKNIGEQVSKFVSSLRKKERTKGYSQFLKFLKFEPPPGKIKKPLSHFRALGIYDMRYPGAGMKGLTVKEIASRIYPQARKEEDKEVVNPELLIYQTLKLVKRNIRNAERGRFPGDFEKNRTKSLAVRRK